MFIKHDSSSKLTALIVYVNDIIVTGNDEGETQRLKIDLSNQLKYFLGIEVAHSKRGISIFQQKYILNLLKETRIYQK